MPPPCPGTAGVSPAFALPALRSKESGRDARGPRVERGWLRRWQSWALGAQHGHGTFRRQTHYMSRERHTSCGRLVALEWTVQRLLARRRTRGVRAENRDSRIGRIVDYGAPVAKSEGDIGAPGGRIQSCFGSLRGWRGARRRA